jgi:hypothetical protein
VFNEPYGEVRLTNTRNPALSWKAAVESPLPFSPPIPTG